jgi:homopolymeric O-antigen transport system permease protein
MPAFAAQSSKMLGADTDSYLGLQFRALVLTAARLERGRMMFAVARSAFTDLSAGLRMRRVWLALAQEDIDDQHRRTTLGPIWLLLNYLIYVGTFILVFGANAPIPNFVAYVSVGMLVFTFLQEVMIRSVSLFVREKSFIAGTTMPITVYILRLAMQCIIRSGYATLGCLAILLFAGTPVTAYWLGSLVGILETLLVSVPTIILFAIGGAFFPDLEFIISNIVRVSMFLTPIFWVSAPGGRGIIARFNPMTYFIDAMRAPIVSNALPIHTMMICAAIILIAWAIAIVLLGKYRRQIVFLL